VSLWVCARDYVYMCRFIHTYIYMCVFVRVCICRNIYVYICIHIYIYICVYQFMYIDIFICMYIQPIAERVAQSLQTIPKNFQFSARILMGFIISTIYYVVLIANPMGRNLVRWKSFRNNLEILCHPVCKGLYVYMNI